MTIDWPAALKAKRVNPHLRNFTASGGRTITGREQRVYSDAGYWVVTVEDIIIKDRATLYAYRAMMAILKQGEDIAIPLPQVYPPVNARANSSTVTIGAYADLRATTIVLDSSGVAIEAGMHLTVGNRLHCVTEVLSEPETPPYQNQIANNAPWMDDQPWRDAVSSTKEYTVKIIPPLRYSVSNGVNVEVETPRARCVLDDPNDGDLSLDLSGVGFVSLTLRENI